MKRTIGIVVGVALLLLVGSIGNLFAQGYGHSSGLGPLFEDAQVNFRLGIYRPTLKSSSVEEYFDYWFISDPWWDIAAVEYEYDTQTFGLGVDLTLNIPKTPQLKIMTSLEFINSMSAEFEGEGYVDLGGTDYDYEYETIDLTAKGILVFSALGLYDFSKPNVKTRFCGGLGFTYCQYKIKADWYWYNEGIIGGTPYVDELWDTDTDSKSAINFTLLLGMKTEISPGSNFTASMRYYDLTDDKDELEIKGFMLTLGYDYRF